TTISGYCLITWFVNRANYGNKKEVLQHILLKFAAMNFAIKRNVSGTRIFICDENNISWPELELSKEEQIFAQSQLKNGQQILTYFRPEGLIYVVAVKAKSNACQTAENIRKLGAKMHQLLQQTAISEVILLNRTTWSFAAYNLAEGICLAAYQFLKYRSDAQKKAHSLKEVNFDKQSISVQEMARLKAVCEAAYLVRDLVNEPLQFLTAEQLSKEIVRAGKTAGFRVQVL